MKTKFKFKRIVTLVIAVMMLVTAMPVGVFAKVNHENLTDDKAKIVNNDVPVKPIKLENGQTAADLIKNPDQPAIYTLRTDYKVQRGEKYDVDYQPYIASVGAAATEDEQKKVKKTIDLPALAGYDEPQENFTINYDSVKNAADGKGQTGNDTNGIRYQANEDFRYKAKSNQIKIKHIFQVLEDFNKYKNPDKTIGDETALFTTQNGNTGSTMEVSPLSEDDPRREGFVPEADHIIMQVPENAENFILEYRYIRAHYDVTFDTAGGTLLPTRTLYYGQVIPKIADADIPTKVGGDFLGWKPSVELKTKDGKKYKANEIIAVGTSGAIKDLDANLIMPASKVTFTAVWKEKEKADYAVQFWAEKADHADDASLLDKYDYIGTRVYTDQDTGSRPDLDNEPVKDIVFTDLDQARLKKIWANARFNRGEDLYLNKFYVYNQALTHEQNKDPKNVNMVKSVDATGKTVYNIYYDRQVYDLYFTKSNAQPEKNTFYPEIWQYDEAQGEAVMKGGPGNLYHYKARFNEMMYKWPNDAKQTKGFTPGYQSFGWGPNYTSPNWPTHLDTPPYRLNADEFLDMEKYNYWRGYTKKIDKGDGTTIDLDKYDFTTLSFGIKQAENSIPHHMDFWMDGFKKGETIIRYDLVRTKADTAAPDYGHRYPRVQGFTPRDYKPGVAWPVIREENEEDGRVDEDRINDLNDEREEITPNNCGSYYNNFGKKLPIGQLEFISSFFSDSDEFGDVKEGGQAFEQNGYLQFHYKRNKYPLRFNYDPSITRDDSYFKSTNQLDTFYEFPLKALSPDADTEESYKTDEPKNILDNPVKLKELELTDLTFTDPADGKLKVKRPDNLSDQMVFKGWALDPAGSKLIWENPGEKMPNHPVNLYAKWGEPDYKWKVTFDPNGGSLRNIKEEDLTTSRKKIQEGDIGQEEINTYAKKEANEGDKQVFTVIQRQKLVEPKYKPTRKGYDFMGWEVIHYKKDANTGDYTNEQDTSYRDTYKVPELYSFGNDVVAPVYLKAIWLPNDKVDVKVVHHFLSLDLSKETKPPLEQILANKRANYLVATTGDQQNDELMLAPHEELSEKLTGDLKTLYEEYNKRVKANNTYFQQFRVEPEKIVDKEESEKQGKTVLKDNPDVKNNVFHFFYKPFRTREYKVNYIDERFKDDPEKGKIIDQELVTNGNRHFDARNYRPIPGWKLVSAPQQQLFFDVNEKTNEFLGINGTGKDEITFYYKDVRVIEVPKDGKTPEGYVRVTFKADKGGSFGKDAEGKDIIELNYDVIKGLQSQLLPVPKELSEGETVDKDKHYITPETGKKFTKWDNKPLLNDNTIINEAHEFTAYFEWSGLSATGLVRTEAFKDPNGTWTNDFAPTIDQLKKQLVWKEKDEVKDLPAGTEIKLFDEAGNELTKDEQVYNLVTEKKAADKDELVRTVNVKAKVKFQDQKTKDEKIKALEEDIKNLNTNLAVAKEELDRLRADNPQDTVKIEEKEKEVQSLEKQISDKTAEIEKIKAGNDTQELDIPITVYKNVYEALNKAGDKPLFLKEAEGKEAKDGGLKEILKDNTENRYIKVTIKPNKDFTNKDDKVYYVNPNAWVDIPELKVEDPEAAGTGFINWTADKVGQNDDGKANGKFDFAKRHKFTEDTIITPVDVKDVVEQTDPNKKPDVPNGYVKVIVKTTEDGIEKATKTTKFERTFWVNPTKDVTIPVNPPTGDVVKDASGNGVTDAAGNAIVWEFKEWKSKEAAPRTWKDTIEAKFGEETTIEAKYEKTIPEPTVEASLVETYVGRKPELDDYKGALKASLGNAGIDFDTNVKSITVITEPKVDQAGMSEAKVKVEFKNGQVKEVAVPVKVDSNIYPGDSNGNKTSDTPKDYVKVTVNPKTYEEYGQQIKVYYVNPKVKVTIPELAIKDSDKEKYGFKKWTTDNNTINLLNPEEVYDFTKEYQFKDATEIYAYFEKNGEPEIQIDFNTKEIVKNIGDTVSVQEYKNAIVIPKDADGKDIVEVKGINILEDANTSEAGYTTAKIQVVYDDGKTEELIVLVKVLPDYVEQKEGEDKPDVPNDFVKVIVKTKEKVDMNGVVTEEERATNETAFERTFWVNPTKHITIDVTNPTGIKDITDNRTWNFDYWKVDTDDGAEYRTIITDQFTKDTTILAKYTKDEVQKPSVKDIITEEGVQPNKKDYLDKLEAPDGKSINDIKIIKEPNVSRPGISTATIEVEYDDGTKALVDVKVFVQRKNELRPSEPQIIYRDRIVEKEKIVEKIVKIKDNERLKELRYMQGYNGKFRPYDGLRRSEAAQILANALKADGYAYDPFYPISYTDIGDTWYTEAVRIVSQAGVFQGYSDGTFKPEGKITRAEWVATLRRFQDLKKVSGNDMGLSMGHWATEEIEAAYQAGWLDVYTSGIATFDANAPITRQEVAAVSNKAFDRVLDKAYLRRNVNNMIHYKDINPSMPLYEDILCASNTLLSDGKYYKANAINNDTLTYNIITDDLLIYQKKFQFFTER